MCEHTSETSGSCVVLAEAELEPAGHVPRTTPRPPGLAERVLARRPADLPGVEHWRVEASTRLWTLYHERYSFCVAHDCPGPQSWKYRRRTYGMRPDTTTMLIAPGEIHVTTQVPLSNFHVVMVEPTAVARELSTQSTAICQTFSGGQADRPMIARLFSSLCRAIEDPHAGRFERRALLRQFLLAALDADGKHREASSTGCDGAVVRVREILHSQSAESLSLELFEQETGVSRYHLERSFKAKMGVPIHRYLKLVRLERARALLRRGRSAIDTARSTGFFDSAHMTRTFKAELGITPGAYARASR
jgi:AraC-like DNA-binding protein